MRAKSREIAARATAANLRDELEVLARQGRRARAAYYQENHCRCGTFVGRIQSRQQPRCADCARQKAKNNRVRRAA